MASGLQCQSSDSHSPVIGIDLGTSKCSVAVVRNGKVEILENERGNMTTPSYVAFTDTETLIGEEAKEQAAFNPTNTIFGIKRIIGRNMSDPQIPHDQKYWPFELVDIEGKPLIKVKYKGEFTFLLPELITAMLLTKMKQIAESHLKCPVEAAVISVPANFNNAQRQATKDAAEIAGLEVLALVNEPTASAVAYLDDKKNVKEEVLVVDLGGGKFDVALIQLRDNNIKVKNVVGSTGFGGLEFDKLTKKTIKSKLESNINVDTSTILKAVCNFEDYKLKSTVIPNVYKDFVLHVNDIQVLINRSEYSQQIMSMMDSVKPILKTITCDQMGTVLLTGAVSLMPIVKEFLLINLGVTSSNVTEIDGSVAAGAAILAAAAVGNYSHCRISVENVYPHCIYFVVCKICCVRHLVIPLNTSYPHSDRLMPVDLHHGGTVSVYEHWTTNYDNEYNAVDLIAEINPFQNLQSFKSPVVFSYYIDNNGLFHSKIYSDDMKELVLEQVSNIDRTTKEKLLVSMKSFAFDAQVEKERQDGVTKLETLCLNLKRNTGVALQSEHAELYKSLHDECCAALTWLDSTSLAASCECQEKFDLLTTHFVSVEKERNSKKDKISANKNDSEEIITSDEITGLVGTCEAPHSIATVSFETLQTNLYNDIPISSKTAPNETGLSMSIEGQNKTCQVLLEDNVQDSDHSLSHQIYNSTNIKQEDNANHLWSANNTCQNAVDKLNKTNGHKSVENLGMHCANDAGTFHRGLVSQGKKCQSPVIGIDLGTSKCCVAVVRNGKVEILENERGNKTTPSYVAFTDTERLVGEEAKEQAAFNATNTIFWIKRIIGRTINDLRICKEFKYIPYNIMIAEGKLLICVTYRHKQISLLPEQITAMLLTKMKQIAESHLNCPVEAAVISVPANFNNAQRQATKDAAEIAGLKVLELINEPTAATIAYLDGKEDVEEQVYVVDFGGGKLDVSLISLENENVTVHNVSGDVSLGGLDVDICTCKYLLNQREDKADFLRYNEKARVKLFLASEKLKHTLTLLQSDYVQIDCLFNQSDFEYTFNRIDFEEQCSHLLNLKVEDILTKLSSETQKSNYMQTVTPSRILLVGGCTRIPMVQDTLRRVFGDIPLDKSLNADEAVAHGAALRAAALAGQETLQSTNIREIPPHKISIASASGELHALIDFNSSVTKPALFLLTDDLRDEFRLIEHNIPTENIYSERNELLHFNSNTLSNHCIGNSSDFYLRYYFDQSGIFCPSLQYDENDLHISTTCKNITEMVKIEEKFISDCADEKSRIQHICCLEIYCLSQMSKFKEKNLLKTEQIKIILNLLEQTIDFLDSNPFLSLEECNKKRVELESQVSRWGQQIESPRDCGATNSNVLNAAVRENARIAQSSKVSDNSTNRRRVRSHSLNRIGTLSAASGLQDSLETTSLTFQQKSLKRKCETRNKTQVGSHFPRSSSPHYEDVSQRTNPENFLMENKISNMGGENVGSMNKLHDFSSHRLTRSGHVIKINESQVLNVFNDKSRRRSHSESRCRKRILPFGSVKLEETHLIGNDDEFMQFFTGNNTGIIQRKQHKIISSTARPINCSHCSNVNYDLQNTEQSPLCETSENMFASGGGMGASEDSTVNYNQQKSCVPKIKAALHSFTKCDRQATEYSCQDRKSRMQGAIKPIRKLKPPKQ